MESFVIIGFISGIYSVTLTAFYLSIRKEKAKGIQAGFELLKGLIWVGAALYGPMVGMQTIEENYQLSLNKTDRFYMLTIWLSLLWGYIGFVAFKAWKKGELIIYGNNGKIIYEGRKRKNIS